MVHYKVLIAAGIMVAGAKAASVAMDAGHGGGHGSSESATAVVQVEPIIQKVDELPEILAAIHAEHEALAAKRAEIENGQARLDLASAAVGKQIIHLEALRKRIEGLVSNAGASESADIERLVKIYRAMKPDQAGPIMNDMDIEVSVLVLGSMDEKSAGPILANMNVTRAQAISKIIFERSRLPGNQNLVNIKLN